MWDFDGTLVDSRHRNLSVNRSIVERLTGRTWADFKALTSVSEYDAAVARCTNWRDFYEREFELRGLQIESAGRLWTEYQLRDGTPVPPFEGVTEALDALAHLPQGIVSQNARDIITATLGASGTVSGTSLATRKSARGDRSPLRTGSSTASRSSRTSLPAPHSTSGTTRRTPRAPPKHGESSAHADWISRS
jgi:hypothetical protein